VQVVADGVDGQSTMYFEWTKLSGSTAAVVPQVMKKALIAAESQNVRSDTTAPSLLKNASPVFNPFSRPSVPR
jgi:hypothetical protein